MGLNSARKLKSNHKKKQRGQHSNVSSHNNKDPFEGAPQASGIMTERLGWEAKRPNSATRKCIRVKLNRNAKSVLAYVPMDGGQLYTEENDEILLEKTRKRDLGNAVKYQVMKVGGVTLSNLVQGKLRYPPRI